MSKWIKGIFLGVSILLAACGGNGSVAPNESLAPEAQANEVVFQALAQMDLPQEESVRKVEEQLELIRDPVTWNRTWTAYVGTHTPVPTVDFKTEMIILIQIGYRGTGGYEVNVTRIEEQEAKLVVYYTERQPGKNCHVTFAVTHPFQIIKLPEIGKEVTFIKTVQRRNCPRG